MAKLKIDASDPLGAAQALLKASSVDVLGPVRALDHGWQMRVDGAAVTIFENGTVLIQGPREAALRPIFADAPGLTAAPPATPQRKAVSSSVSLPDLPSRRRADWSDEPWDGVDPPF